MARRLSKVNGHSWFWAIPLLLVERNYVQRLMFTKCRLRYCGHLRLSDMYQFHLRTLCLCGVDTLWRLKACVDNFICLVMVSRQCIAIFISSICSLTKQAIIQIMYPESFYSHSIQNLTYGW